MPYRFSGVVNLTCLVLLAGCGRTDLGLSRIGEGSGDSTETDTGTFGSSDGTETESGSTTASTTTGFETESTSSGETSSGSDTSTDTDSTTTEASSSSSDSSTSDTGTTGGPECGDGIVDPSEQCDPGEDAIGPGEACLPGCVLNVCGDGDAGPDEQCDDGNDIDDDGCTNACELTSCGNGEVESGEECDDGNEDDTDACLSNCRDAVCGDGEIQAGVEACDDGPFNSENADCTPICTVNVCGDGFVHSAPDGDEECDPGADEIGPGEACLPGCVLNVCGDGDVGPDEVCDDGNDIDTDECLNGCELPTCGDGFVRAGIEECDDADSNDLDRCHDDCSWHRVTQVALGGNHTCVVFDSGALQCWGNAHDGRTGHVTEEDLGDDEPVVGTPFVDIDGDALSVVAGISHTCVMLPNNRIRCFGRASNGQLGYADEIDIGDDETPGSAPLVSLGGPLSSLNTRIGAFHTCAIRNNGALHCWGRGGTGRLGLPAVEPNDVGDDETPISVGPIDLGATPVQVAVGSEHACARMADGTVRCWGRAADGALGYGNTNVIGDDEAPSAAGTVNLGGTAVQITAGWFHTCARLDSGAVRCWGRGQNGRLGYGNSVWIGDNETPAAVGNVSVGGTVTHVEAGLAHTCALLDDQTVKCWGFSGQGQLGYGNTTSIGDNELPSSVGAVPVGGPVSALASDGGHTCVIMADNGAVRCWGQSGDGRLGYGNLQDIGDDETPAQVGDVPLLAP